jgi:short-subunit dehydrogenase
MVSLSTSNYKQLPHSFQLTTLPCDIVQSELLTALLNKPHINTEYGRIDRLLYNSGLMTSKETLLLFQYEAHNLENEMFSVTVTILYIHT